MVPRIDEQEREQEGDAPEGGEDDAREEGLLHVGRGGVSVRLDLFTRVLRVERRWACFVAGLGRIAFGRWSFGHGGRGLGGVEGGVDAGEHGAPFLFVRVHAAQRLPGGAGDMVVRSHTGCDGFTGGGTGGCWVRGIQTRFSGLAGIAMVPTEVYPDRQIQPAVSCKVASTPRLRLHGKPELSSLYEW